MNPHLHKRAKPGLAQGPKLAQKGHVGLPPFKYELQNSGLTTGLIRSARHVLMNLKVYSVGSLACATASATSAMGHHDSLAFLPLSSFCTHLPLALPFGRRTLHLMANHSPMMRSTLLQFSRCGETARQVRLAFLSEGVGDNRHGSGIEAHGVPDVRTADREFP